MNLVYSFYVFQFIESVKECTIPINKQEPGLEENINDSVDIELRRSMNGRFVLMDVLTGENHVQYIADTGSDIIVTEKAKNKRMAIEDLMYFSENNINKSDNVIEIIYGDKKSPTTIRGHFQDEKIMFVSKVSDLDDKSIMSFDARIMTTHDSFLDKKGEAKGVFGLGPFNKVAEEIKKLSPKEQEHILKKNPSIKEEAEYTTGLEQLFKATKVKKKILSFYLRREIEEQNRRSNYYLGVLSGKMIVGELDPKYYDGNLKIHQNLSKEGSMDILVEELNAHYISDDTVDVSSPKSLALIDSGSPYVYLPKSIYDNLIKKIKSKQINKSPYCYDTSVYPMLPTLYITTSQGVFTIEPKHYTNTLDNYLELKLISGYKLVLGLPFFLNNLVSYNAEYDTIGIAKNRMVYQ